MDPRDSYILKVKASIHRFSGKIELLFLTAGFPGIYLGLTDTTTIPLSKLEQIYRSCN